MVPTVEKILIDPMMVYSPDNLSSDELCSSDIAPGRGFRSRSRHYSLRLSSKKELLYTYVQYWVFLSDCCIGDG